MIAITKSLTFDDLFQFIHESLMREADMDPDDYDVRALIDVCTGELRAQRSNSSSSKTAPSDYSPPTKTIRHKATLPSKSDFKVCSLGK